MYWIRHIDYCVLGTSCDKNCWDYLIWSNWPSPVNSLYVHHQLNLRSLLWTKKKNKKKIRKTENRKYGRVAKNMHAPKTRAIAGSLFWSRFSVWRVLVPVGNGLLMTHRDNRDHIIANLFLLWQCHFGYIYKSLYHILVYFTRLFFI